MFGMRTGGPPRHQHRHGIITSKLDNYLNCNVHELMNIDNCIIYRKSSMCKSKSAYHKVCDQALDLLVSVSFIYYYTSTPDLSTLLSTRGLTNLCYEISNLEAGFTLICFQRLSFPYIATQLCHWRDNWCTIGTSTLVLSY